MDFFQKHDPTISCLQEIHFRKLKDGKRYSMQIVTKREPSGDFPGCTVLRLSAPNAGALGSILGQGTGSQMHAANKEPVSDN